MECFTSRSKLLCIRRARDAIRVPYETRAISWHECHASRAVVQASGVLSRTHCTYKRGRKLTVTKFQKNVVHVSNVPLFVERPSGPHHTCGFLGQSMAQVPPLACIISITIHVNNRSRILIDLLVDGLSGFPKLLSHVFVSLKVRPTASRPRVT